MSGRTKIEKLIHAWYGFDVTSAVVSFLVGSWGILSIVGSVIGLGISLFITWAIGRSLLGKSSLTRAILLIGSGLFTVTGTVGVARSSLYLFDSFSLSLVGMIAWSCVGVYMLGRSFLTLMNADVKAYFK
jgi:hypothetical protein